MLKTQGILRPMMMLSSVLLGGMLGGCAEDQAARPKSEAMGGAPIQEVAPDWVFQKGAAFSGERRVFYGVGNAAAIRNPALRRRSAEAAARRDLQQTFQVYVAGLNKQYMAETTAGDMESVSVEQHIEDVMKQVTDGTLNGADIVNYWEHPTRNEAYALARLDMAQFLEAMQHYASASSQFKELDAKVKAYVRENAAKAHDELNGVIKPQGGWGQKEIAWAGSASFTFTYMYVKGDMSCGNENDLAKSPLTLEGSVHPLDDAQTRYEAEALAKSRALRNIGPSEYCWQLSYADTTGIVEQPRVF